jgi:hypothetical protein
LIDLIECFYQLLTGEIRQSAWAGTFYPLLVVMLLSLLWLKIIRMLVKQLLLGMMNLGMLGIRLVQLVFMGMLVINLGSLVPGPLVTL